MIHFCSYDGLPCLVSSDPAGEAWVFDSEWKQINAAVASHEASVIGKADFKERFGQLPPLPKEAFANEKVGQ